MLVPSPSPCPSSSPCGSSRIFCGAGATCCLHLVALPEVDEEGGKGNFAVQDSDARLVSHADSVLVSSSSLDHKDTLCRNILIYGHCRYENSGCTFNHDQNKNSTTTNANNSTNTNAVANNNAATEA